MANVSKIKLPSGDTYDIKDSRLGNAKIFYGTCATAAGTADKVVVCPEFTQSDLVKGALIFVTFDASNSAAAANLTLNVNSTTAKPLKKQGNSSSANNLAAVGELRANSTYLFQYDGTNWVCMTLDYNSTYSALTEADMKAGTATTGRTITAARLKQAVEYWMAQNQSDWSETDTDSPAYIQNKPTNVSSFTNDAGYTTNIGTITKVGNTTSGEVAVTSSNNTASYGSAVTVGTVGGVDLKFTMPDNTNDIVEITYANLKSLRDNGQLAPGCKYRITDYVATTVQTDTQSANHPFDLIVTALDEENISEQASAVLHEGDTYFANCDLSAWKINYCLDNDTSKFAWADETNGKGVIYELTDEKYNVIPYDFKGIQFKRYKVTPTSTYTSTLSEASGLYLGWSHNNYTPTGFTIDTSDYIWCYTFSWFPESLNTAIDASINSNTCKGNIIKRKLNMASYSLLQTVFMGGTAVSNYLKNIYSTTMSSDLGCACGIETSTDFTYNTFFGGAGHSFLESQFRDNTIVGPFRHSAFGSDTQLNTIVAPNDCAFNRGGGPISRNVIRAKDFAGNQIGPEFQDNHFNVTNLISRNEFVVQFQNNTVTAPTFIGNHFSYRFRRNTLNGSWQNNEVYVGQVDDNIFNCNVSACQITGLLAYVVVPSNANAFALCELKAIRGTSSAPITLDYAGFFIASVSGVKRRIIVEGSEDGKVVATWKDNSGQIVGVYKLPSDTTWTPIESAYLAISDYEQDEEVISAALNDLNSKTLGKEDTSNKVTALSSSSTDTQYPSAKCVYDMIGDIETLINAL